MSYRFVPVGNTVALDATDSTDRVALVVPGDPDDAWFQVRVYNDSDYVAHIAFGGSSVEAAAAADSSPANGIPIPPNDGGFFTVNAVTHMAVVMASGETATVYASCSYAP